MSFRNCDRFATAGQAAHAYNALLCEERRETSPSGDVGIDLAKWLLAPQDAAADGTPAAFLSATPASRRLCRGPGNAGAADSSSDDPAELRILLDAAARREAVLRAYVLELAECLEEEDGARFRMLIAKARSVAHKGDGRTK